MKDNPLLTPTQYDKKLAEVYERQSRQIQTAHDQARQRDQQMVDKAKAEDPVKMLEQFASTVSSVSKFAKARDEQIAKNVASELGSQDFGINEDTGKAYTDKEILEVQAKYKKQTKSQASKPRRTGGMDMMKKKGYARGGAKMKKMRFYIIT